MRGKMAPRSSSEVMSGISIVLSTWTCQSFCAFGGPYYLTTDRPGAEEIQLDLILDYRSNLERYPEIQAYFRSHQSSLLAVWIRHDPAFIPAGAEAYKRDLPNTQVDLLDTGHFALETHASEIARAIRSFLGRHL